MLISGTVKIFVSDFEKSVVFYVDTIGFLLKERVGRVSTKLEKSGLTIEIRPFPIDKKNSRQDFTLGIGVSNFATVFRRLKESETSFSRFKDEGENRVISLYDPDGVLIYLRETAL